MPVTTVMMLLGTDRNNSQVSKMF